MNSEPATSFSYDSLPPDVAQMARAHAIAITHMGRRVRDLVVDAGNRLLQAKAGLGHGGFGSWLEAELPWISQATAERMMNAARLVARFGSLPNLSLDAMYALAAPSTPESVIEDVLANRIPTTPKELRAEIVRRKGGATSHSPAPEAWEALRRLVERYPNHRDLSAELLVQLAYDCHPPDPASIEREITSYYEDDQENVRDSVYAFAEALDGWRVDN